MSHKITIVCDQCGTQHLLDEESQDMPPHWIGMKLFMADWEGLVPPSERDDIYLHFCKPDCASNYMSGSDVELRLRTIDKDREEVDDDEGED